MSVISVEFFSYCCIIFQLCVCAVYVLCSRLWNLDCLLRVKAQVMTRDNETGMWVPLGGGGMSVISLHRVHAPGTNGDGKDVTCLILGERIADRIVGYLCKSVSWIFCLLKFILISQ